MVLGYDSQGPSSAIQLWMKRLHLQNEESQELLYIVFSTTLDQRTNQLLPWLPKNSNDNSPCCKGHFFSFEQGEILGNLNKTSIQNSSAPTAVFLQGISVSVTQVYLQHQLRPVCLRIQFCVVP